VFQIGKGSGGLQFIMHEHRRADCLDLIEYGRQWLIFDKDRLRRGFPHMRTGGKGHRQRLAGKPHFSSARIG
jgi:hypothetical protein